MVTCPIRRKLVKTHFKSLSTTTGVKGLVILKAMANISAGLAQAIFDDAIFGRAF